MGPPISAMWQGVSVAVLYGAVSIAVNFINKYAVMVLPLPATLMVIKTLATLLIVVGLNVAGFIKLQPVTAARIHNSLPITLVYCAHAVLVLRSLVSLNVPVYNTIKRLTPMMVLSAKAYMDKKWPESQITLSVVLVVSGCVVAGVGDLTFDSLGYLSAFLCALMQAAYILLAEHSGKALARQQTELQLSSNAMNEALAYHKDGGGGGNAAQYLGADDQDDVEGEGGRDSEKRRLLPAANAFGGGKDGQKGGGGNGSSAALSGGSASPRANGMSPSPSFINGGAASAAAASAALSPWEVLYYVGLLGTPMLVAMLFCTEEPHKVVPMIMSTYYAFGPINFTVWLVFTAVAECALTGCMVWCAHVTSAVTTSLVGVLKGVVAVVLGFFLLGGVKFHWLNVTGIGMNLSGGVWYSMVKMRQNKGKAAGVSVIG